MNDLASNTPDISFKGRFRVSTASRRYKFWHGKPRRARLVGKAELGAVISTLKLIQCSGPRPGSAPAPPTLPPPHPRSPGCSGPPGPAGRRGTASSSPCSTGASALRAQRQHRGEEEKEEGGGSRSLSRCPAAPSRRSREGYFGIHRGYSVACAVCCPRRGAPAARCPPGVSRWCPGPERCAGSRPGP